MHNNAFISTLCPSAILFLYSGLFALIGFMEVLQFLNLSVEIIRKPGRRSLTLVMHPEKPLSIRTNKRTSQSQITEFLQLKLKWIEKNLHKFKVIEEQFKQPDLTVGALYPFLGELKYLQFSEARGRRFTFSVEEGFFICGVPKGRSLADYTPAYIRREIGRYYRTEAEKYLQQRLSIWVAQTGLNPSRLVFRANKTRWGSCSAAGLVSLNWKLICQPTALIDYVIIHELCHLRHLNHSKDFWQLVGEFFPDHKSMKSVLNQQQHLGRFLD